MSYWHAVYCVGGSNFHNFVPELALILFITIGLWLKIMFCALNLIFLLKQQFTKYKWEKL